MEFMSTMLASMNILNATNKSFSQLSNLKLGYEQVVPLHLYIVFMVAVHIVGVVGNSLAIIVIVKQKKMQTYTNWMILNLAVSDLAVTLFCIPLDIPLLLQQEWVYGKVFCSVYYPIGTAQLFSSTFTLVNITYVRFYAICYPFKEQPSVLHAKVMIVVIRVFSAVLVLPIVIVLKYDEVNQICYEDWNKISEISYTVSVFLLGYAIPLTVITIGYCCIIKEIVVKKREGEGLVPDEHTLKENKMLVKLSVAVTVTFAVCVLPNQLVFMFYTFGNLENYDHHMDLLFGSHMMLFLYCAINPIIYNKFSEKFRKRVRNLIQEVRSRFSFRITLRRRRTINSLHPCTPTPRVEL